MGKKPGLPRFCFEPESKLVESVVPVALGGEAVGSLGERGRSQIRRGGCGDGAIDQGRTREAVPRTMRLVHHQGDRPAVGDAGLERETEVSQR